LALSVTAVTPSFPERGRTTSGRPFLDAIFRGDIPPLPICDLVDFSFAAIADGRVDMVLKPQKSQYNPIGSVHGGIIATVLDSVMGCAVHTQLPAGRTYTTLAIKVNYLRGINRDTGSVTAIGRVIHLGRRRWLPTALAAFVLQAPYNPECTRHNTSYRPYLCIPA